MKTGGARVQPRQQVTSVVLRCQQASLLALYVISVVMSGGGDTDSMDTGHVAGHRLS